MAKLESNSRDARQGNQSPRVLYVLLAAVALALLAMTTVNLFGGLAPDTLGVRSVPGASQSEAS